MSHERGRDPPARVLRTAYETDDDDCQSIERDEASEEAIHNVATTSPATGHFPRLSRDLEHSAAQPISPTIPTDGFGGPRYKDQVRDERPETIPLPSSVMHSTPQVGPDYKDQVRPYSWRAFDDALPVVMAVAVPDSLPMDHVARAPLTPRAVASSDVTAEAAATAADVLPIPNAALHIPNSATVDDDDTPSPRFAAFEALDPTRRAPPQPPPQSPTKTPLRAAVETDGPTAEERRRSDERRQMSAERLRLLFALPQKLQQQEEESSLHSASNFGSPTQRDHYDNFHDASSWWDEALEDEHALRRLRLGGEWADQQQQQQQQQESTTNRAVAYNLSHHRAQPHGDGTKRFVPATSAPPPAVTRSESDRHPKSKVASSRKALHPVERGPRP
jgi:hypothetical protein